jgi:hypothetical protein
MDLINLFGLFAFVPAVLLITLSFFVMFTLIKTEKSVLRIFGMVIVGVLWITALIVFSAGIFMVAEGSDYFGDHGLAKRFNCRCSTMRNPESSIVDYSYHKKMMPTTEGMMNPHQGMMMDPHQEMMGAQSSGMPCKYMNSTRQDMMNKDMTSSGMKK